MMRFSLLVALAATLPAQRGNRSVEMTQLRAAVAIVDGVATTTLHQTLHNPTRRQAEAVWVLPLPDGAVADEFTMTVGGVKLEGEVLDANGARAVYESIVRRRRDPGLLEYVGRGALRARIFPIPAQRDAEVEVRFRHVLPDTGGLLGWRFPLQASGLEGKAPKRVTMDVCVQSSTPLSNVFSPVAGVDIVRKGEREARLSFEGSGAQHKELSMFYGLSEKEFGLNLLTFRKAGEPGYFTMLISPKRDWADEQVLEKSITFVIDTSGSMSGKKIEQAKAALRFFLKSLRPEDHFNIVPFSTEASPFHNEPVRASSIHVEAALARVDTIDARGGTNIQDALARGIARRVSGKQVPITVFLTDGQPSVGVTNVDELLAVAKRHNPSAGRIFVFGVGNDVNTHLLDKLAGNSGGTRNYVRQNEDIEVATGDLFTKLSYPVMTDLKLSADGAEISHVVPSTLPDLFRGSRIVVVGRYTGDGHHAIRLEGHVRGAAREYVFEGDFQKQTEQHEFVASLWAERRVGVLLDAIRLNGPNRELMEEIQKLGREFHIVTPYTSHLILEEGLDAHNLLSRAQPPSGPSTPAPSAQARARRVTPTGPATGGPAGPATAGGGGGRGRPAPADIDALASRLEDAGVLPKGATREQLRELALEVARELQQSQHRVQGLGAANSGGRAIDESEYLRQIMDPTVTASDDFFLGSGRTAAPASRLSKPTLLSLFTRKVHDKVFHLRAGIWTDRTYDAKRMEADLRTVVAFSDEYFAMVKREKRLARYFAFSERMIVVIKGKAYQVTPKA